MSRRSRSVLTALLACVLLVVGPVGTALARSPNAHPKETAPAPSPAPTAAPTLAATPVVLVVTAAPSAHVPPGQAKKETAVPVVAGPTSGATTKEDGQGKGRGKETTESTAPAASGAEAQPTADVASGPSAGGPTQQLACGNGKPALAPAPTPTPAPTEAPTAEPAPTTEPGPTSEPSAIVIPGVKASSASNLLDTLADSAAGKIAASWFQRFKDQAIRDFCNVNALRNTLRAEVDSRLKNLAAMEKLVVGTGLSDADLAAIRAKLSAVAADLRAIAGRVEAATTLAALEAERAALAAMNQLPPTTARWVNDVRAAETATASADTLRDRELTLLALMTTLPPDRAAVVAPLLEQLGEFLDAGRAAARSALESLLAVPASDLERGGAATSLAGAEATLGTANAALARAAAIADQVEPLVGM